MAEAKTRPTDASVEEFLSTVPDERRRADCEVVLAMMRDITGEPAVMWGTSIVGFGSLSYNSARGPARSWPVVAFAPRVKELVLYLNTHLEDSLFEGLGAHRRGVGCLYLRSLSAVDLDALRRLVARSVVLARG